MYTVLIVQFDLTSWQPDSFNAYPPTATLLGKMSDKYGTPETVETPQEAADLMNAANQGYANCFTLMAIGIVPPQWAIAISVEQAEIILAQPPGHWFELKFKTDWQKNTQPLERVEHMAAPEYHEKFSVN